MFMSNGEIISIFTKSVKNMHCQFRIQIVWTDFITRFQRIFDWFGLNANCSIFYVYMFTIFEAVNLYFLKKWQYKRNFWTEKLKLWTVGFQ